MLWWLPTIKLFLLLLHKCNFVTVLNCDVNIWYSGYQKYDVFKSLFNSQRGCDPQAEECCSRLWQSVMIFLDCIFILKLRIHGSMVYSTSCISMPLTCNEDLRTYIRKKWWEKSRQRIDEEDEKKEELWKRNEWMEGERKEGRKEKE